MKIYEEIKFKCDKYVYLSENYTNDCMLIRNQHLVNNSSCCVCYLKQSRGGTAYTVNYAKKQGLTIHNIADMK